MNKNIEKIVNDSMPECKVRGHRVHVTITRTDEDWPAWSKCIVGIRGGFIHFENEQDSIDWRNANKTEAKATQKTEAKQEEGGRCVPECGPIGFKYAA